MKRLLALALLLPALAWAGAAKDAQRAAERVLVDEDVLNVYVTANDNGRVTLLFGKQVANWQIDAVLEKLADESAIKGVTHSKTDTEFCPIR